MKRILLTLALVFGFSSLAFAAGEGPVLGKAWKDANAVFSTIADKDSATGNWVWSADKISENGDKAEKDLAKITAELETTVAADEDAKACTGKNSIKSLSRLIKHAVKAIHDLSAEDESTSDSDDDSTDSK
jgi:ABC-type transporter Mla subunit MlaD